MSKRHRPRLTYRHRASRPSTSLATGNVGPTLAASHAATDPTERDLLHITICKRKWPHYFLTGYLKPVATISYWKTADHCESCGTTEGKLVRHPDLTIRMTICKREYIHYKNNRVLSGIMTIDHILSQPLHLDNVSAYQPGN